MYFDVGWKRSWFPLPLRFLLCILAACYVIAACSIRYSRKSPNRDVVLALYHFWDGSEEVFERLAGNWKPIFVPYSTKNETITARHVEWAHQNSVDGFIVPWVGVETWEDVHLRRGLLRSENIDLIQFALSLRNFTALFDAEHARKTRRAKHRRPFQAALRYINKAYFNHASYLRVNGKAVLFVPFNPSKARLTRVAIAKARRFLDTEIFVVGDICDAGLSWDPAELVKDVRASAPGFDAFFCSNVIRKRRMQGSTELLQYFRRVVLPVYRSWSRAHVFLPTIIPYYKNFRGRNRDSLTSIPEDFAAEVSLVRALPCGVQTLGKQFLVVQSFNDWLSSTSLEPSRRNGYDYLNVLHSIRG